MRKTRKEGKTQIERTPTRLSLVPDSEGLSSINVVSSKARPHRGVDREIKGPRMVLCSQKVRRFNWWARDEITFSFPRGECNEARCAQHTALIKPSTTTSCSNQASIFPSGSHSARSFISKRTRYSLPVRHGNTSICALLANSDLTWSS